ncbi:hypothetical protein [Phenylobacterium sp.]|uniref:hypothetical protein n=1 Tax=Phenylobacterium sp. TaxID=1871053 RepID=UPI0025E1E561|nr:hypothetical protein [Phenylobacterium sp.]MBX3486174.1 hypothetical protein [Phenylobacterium sp.]
MRKFIASALAALTFGGAVLAAAAPAQADSRYRYYRHHSSGNTAATAAIAGIAGLAIGAAIADGNRGRSSSYYSSGYSSRGYYDNGYRYDPRDDGYYGSYYDRGPRTCVTRERVWDPYIRRNVMIERSYRC